MQTSSKTSSKKVDERLVPAIIWMWFKTENQDQLPLSEWKRTCERELYTLLFPTINVEDWECKAVAWLGTKNWSVAIARERLASV